MTPPMERIFVVVVVVFVSTSGAEDHSGDDKRSNVILILTDDQDWTLGSMKAMPKTDKLFENRGTRFLNGFVTTPICCPSRASILTGQYAHNHNVTSNVEGECYSLAWINGPEKQTIGQRMKDAGYATAFFGKYINGYKGKLVPGWDEWLALQGNSKYYNYTLARYNSQQNFTYLERHADNERDYLPTLMTERALLHMQKVMIQKPRKPLFMILSYPSPHGPEEADYKYQHKYQKETVPRKANFNNGTDGKHWMMRYRPPLSQTNIEFIDLLYQRRLQTLYSVDNAVHELFLRLWLMNALNNSYVFLTSDHGYHLGQFRCLKGKGLPYEDDIRVPFFAYGPRIPKRIVTEIVLNIDLAPTFLDIAGVPVPKTMDGVSILELFDTNGTNSQWRTSFLIERFKAVRNQKAEKILTALKRAERKKANLDSLRPMFNNSSKEFANASLLDTCFNQYKQYKAKKTARWSTLKVAYYGQVDTSKCIKKSQVSHCKKNGEKGCEDLVCPEFPTSSSDSELPSEQCMNVLRKSHCVVPKLNCKYYSKDLWKTDPKYKGDSFCYCSGVTNGSFWCERRIEEKENYLYCVFVTRFEEYYDLKKDPFQLTNLAVENPVLNTSFREALLDRLKTYTKCKGAGEESCKNAGRQTPDICYTC